MNDSDDSAPRGFQFPGRFEISAMGAADSGLERWVPDTLEAAGLTVVRSSLRVRASRAGRYVSVSLRSGPRAADATRPPTPLCARGRR